MSVGEIASIAGLFASFIGGIWAVAKWFDQKIEDRFQAQEKARTEGRRLYEERIARVEAQHNDLERAFFKHLADMPVNYMRREDHIRFETVLNAKLDAVAAKQDLLAERLPRRD